MRNKIIKDFGLTKQEIAQLDLLYGDAWVKKAPAMYIGSMRRANEVHYCSECGCQISASDYEDYGMCESCRENWRD